MNLLNQFFVKNLICRPQGGVPVDQSLDCLPKCFPIEFRTNAGRECHMIGGTFRRGLLDKPQSSLAVGKREGLYSIASTLLEQSDHLCLLLPQHSTVICPQYPLGGSETQSIAFEPQIYATCRQFIQKFRHGFHRLSLCLPILQPDSGIDRAAITRRPPPILVLPDSFRSRCHQPSIGY